jgi:hypothetical protein
MLDSWSAGHEAHPQRKTSGPLRERRCECGRRAACPARVSRARPGYIHRRGHDLCTRCYTALRNQLRALSLWKRGIYRLAS